MVGQAAARNKCKKKKPPQQPPQPAQVFQPQMQQSVMPQVLLGLHQFAQQPFFTPQPTFQAGQAVAQFGAAPPVLGVVGASEPVAGPGVLAGGKEKTKKTVCWKCAVNTHATKDCTDLHYCLVYDNTAHPTVRCPTLKLPKPSAFTSGFGTDDTMFLQFPDSVCKEHLLPSSLPTALVTVVGESVPTEAIQSLMSRM